jgi:putative SOS response-associated peptidase YedK
MCGRFVGYSNLERLLKYFPIDKTACKATASYNIAPTQEVLAIVRRAGENWLDKFHWGLVPFWAKAVSIGTQLINARSETVAKKPSFRAAFKKRRCLIPADGFYEWQGATGTKQPLYLRLPGHKPFAFAGLWERWTPRDADAEAYQSCTIITTAASTSVKPIHHRMPVIVKPEKYGRWLDPECGDPTLLRDILENWTVEELVATPVSKRVNSARNDDPSNIRPLTQMKIDF